MPDHRIRGAVGSCGSGKTFTLAKMVAQAVRKSQATKARGVGEPWRFLAIDWNAELPGREASRGRPQIHVTVVATPEEAAAKLEAGWLYVVVRPPLEVPGDDQPAKAFEEERRRFADRLARVAIDGPPTILVIPEAHTVAREHKPLPPALFTIAHRYRHEAVQAGLWWDTQHFRDVSKDLVNSSTLLLLFANGAKRDLDRIRAIGGQELEAQVLEAGRKVVEEGEAGHHVQVRTIHPRPPFKLVRL